MFGLAAAASCMPCQADWLNDLSLMPPVSVTMQPRKLLPAAEAVLAADDDGLDVLDDGALDELVPQAARSRLVADMADLPAIHGVCFTVPSTGTGCAGCPGITGLPLAQTARKTKTCKRPV